MHVLFFLGGLQNESEEVQDGGVAVCNDGTGDLYFDLPGRLNGKKEWYCVHIFFCFILFLKEEVKLCDVKVDCKSIRLSTGQPKI